MLYVDNEGPTPCLKLGDQLRFSLKDQTLSFWRRGQTIRRDEAGDSKYCLGFPIDIIVVSDIALLIAASIGHYVHHVQHNTTKDIILFEIVKSKPKESTETTLKR